jgi:hypothetical protein
MLHLFLDPFYIFRTFKKILGIDKQPSSTEFADTRIRRYSLAQLRSLFHEYDMHEIRSLSTSYGPLKFWRKELLPLATSMRISDALRHWSALKIFSALTHVGNHLTITLRKGSIPAGPANVGRTSL